MTDIKVDGKVKVRTNLPNELEYLTFDLDINYKDTVNNLISEVSRIYRSLDSLETPHVYIPFTPIEKISND